MDQDHQHYSKSRTKDLEKLANLIKSNLQKGLFHGFSSDELNKIQSLIKELTMLIAASDLFDTEHKERVLERLDKLESELYKDIDNIDKFWGLFGEAGVMLGKLGKDAKPFVDRIEHIMKIASTAETREEESASEGPTAPDIDKED